MLKQGGWDSKNRNIKDDHNILLFCFHPRIWQTLYLPHREENDPERAIVAVLGGERGGRVGTKPVQQFHCRPVTLSS
jgi:hypothetical protein